MKPQHTLLLLLVAIPVTLGCDDKPVTPREEAEQAQEELAEAREDAADLIDDAEQEAIDTLADAREEATHEVDSAKQDAEEMVSNAEENLEQKLDQLGDQTLPLKEDVKANAADATNDDTPTVGESPTIE